MKSKYSLQVNESKEDVSNRIMKMPGAIVYEDTSYFGQQRAASRMNRICLREFSESQIEFSENFGLGGFSELLGDISLKELDRDKTEVVARFQIGPVSINGWKIIMYVLMFLIVMGSAFIWKFLLDVGAPAESAIKYAFVSGAILFIFPVFVGLMLLKNSGRLTYFLVSFSNALGGGYDWK